MEPVEKPNGDSEIEESQTARLAFRGALETIRNLQNINARLKGELQEKSSRDRFSNQRASSINSDHEALQNALSSAKAVLERSESEKNTLKEALEQKEARLLEARRAKVDVVEQLHEQMHAMTLQHHSAIREAVAQTVREKQAEMWEFKRLIAEKTQALEELERRLHDVDADTEHKISRRLIQQQKELEVKWSLRERDLLDEARQNAQQIEARLRDQFEQKAGVLLGGERQQKESFQKQLDVLEKEYQVRAETLQAEFAEKERRLFETIQTREEGLRQVLHDKEERSEKAFRIKESKLLEEHVRQLDSEKRRRESDLQELDEKWQGTHQTQMSVLRTQLAAEQTLQVELETRFKKETAERERELGEQQEEALEKVILHWKEELDRQTHLLKNQCESLEQVSHTQMAKVIELTKKLHESEKTCQFGQEALQQAQRDHKQLEELTATWREHAAKKEQDYSGRLKLSESQVGQVRSELAKLKTQSSEVIGRLADQWVFSFAEEVREAFGAIRSLSESLAGGKSLTDVERQYAITIQHGVDHLMQSLEKWQGGAKRQVEENQNQAA